MRPKPPKHLLVDSCGYCGVEKTFIVAVDSNTGRLMEGSARSLAGWFHQRIGNKGMWLCSKCNALWEDAVVAFLARRPLRWKETD